MWYKSDVWLDSRSWALRLQFIIHISFKNNYLNLQISWFTYHSSQLSIYKCHDSLITALSVKDVKLSYPSSSSCTVQYEMYKCKIWQIWFGHAESNNFVVSLMISWSISCSHELQLSSLSLYHNPKNFRRHLQGPCPTCVSYCYLIWWVLNFMGFYFCDLNTKIWKHAKGL